MPLIHLYASMTLKGKREFFKNKTSRPIIKLYKHWDRNIELKIGTTFNKYNNKLGIIKNFCFSIWNKQN